ELEPGVWEVDVASRRPDEESFYELGVRFDGLAVAPAKITSWTHSGGKPPSGSMTLTNAFKTPLAVSLSGALEGVRKTEKVKLTPDKDTAKLKLKFEPDFRAARIRFDMTEEQYAMFTDVAVNVYDASGKSIVKDGMADRHYRGEVASPGGS